MVKRLISSLYQGQKILIINDGWQLQHVGDILSYVTIAIVDFSDHMWEGKQVEPDKYVLPACKVITNNSRVAAFTCSCVFGHVTHVKSILLHSTQTPRGNIFVFLILCLQQLAANFVCQLMLSGQRTLGLGELFWHLLWKEMWLMSSKSEKNTKVFGHYIKTKFLIKTVAL